MTQILLANPRGFCAGVERAITIVERALEMFGAPIYVHNHIVHNRHVVDNLRERGAVFVYDMTEIPTGSICIFSAHGVSQQVVDTALERDLQVFDATCPLVTKVHMEIARYARNAIDCIIIGHAGHPEIEGTRGRYHGDGKVYLVEDAEQAEKLQVSNPERLGFVSQTTLSIRDTESIVNILKRRFPTIQAPARDDICYATQNRQNAVIELAQHCDCVLVIGSAHSSNSNRLRELAESCGATAYLVDDADNINANWVREFKTIGVTAGASAPEVLVQQVLAKLTRHGAEPARELKGITETVRFSIPRELRAC